MIRFAMALLAGLALIFNAMSAHAQEKLPVVASFSILADLVREVGGERVSVESLVGTDTDMHGFQPAPADAKKAAAAKLVVVNGLGLEGWTERLIKSAGFKGPVIVATKGIKPLAARHQHGHDHGHGHAHGASDPHAWQSVANVKVYVGNIRDGLIAADPAGKAEYEKNASAYLAKLDALDAEIKASLAGVDRKARRVIVSHDAFRYFGAAYGVDFLAAQAAGGDTQPSAGDVAKLIRQIRQQKVRAVFVENISDPRVIAQIAKETGLKLGGTLYSDALSAAAGPAASYLALMRHNATAIAAALKGG